MMPKFHCSFHQGMKVVRQIEDNPVEKKSNRPKKEVKIVDCGVEEVEEPFSVDKVRDTKTIVKRFGKFKVKYTFHLCRPTPPSKDLLKETRLS